MKTICLIGMMGSGKTSAAELFAKTYGVEFLDADKIIEDREHKSITDIFEQKGEEYFRQIEKLAILMYFKPKDTIFSLGGGAFEDEQTREFLLKNSTVIYLKTSAKTIYNRLKNDNTRPLLSGKMDLENINNILKNREKNYLLAHKIIATDNKTLQQIVTEINQ